MVFSEELNFGAGREARCCHSDCLGYIATKPRASSDLFSPALYASRVTGNVVVLSPPRKGVQYSMDPVGGPATKASYRKTKEYLLAHGHTGRDVMDATNFFHLRNYAETKGVDLAPLRRSFHAAFAAVALARRESKPRCGLVPWDTSSRSFDLAMVSGQLLPTPTRPHVV